MPECKRCGATQVVKSGKAREKQRYLCKQCGCHFVEGDQRRKGLSAEMKALCTFLQAVNVKDYKLVASYMNRDASLIHRWMHEGPRRESGCGAAKVLQFGTVRSLLEAMERDSLGNCGLLLVENGTEDLYYAVVLQGRKVAKG